MRTALLTRAAQIVGVVAGLAVLTACTPTTAIESELSASVGGKVLPGATQAQGVAAKRYGEAVGQLEATPETITLAFAHRSQLDDTAARIDDGSLAHLYTFEGARGDTVQVAMTSDAFEPYLALGYGASTVAHGRLQRVRPLAEAQAIAGRAELVVVLPVDGPYTLMANAAAPGQQGAYAINARAIVQAEADALVVTAKVATPRLLAPGTTATGQLTKADPTFQDGTGYQTWLFDGTEGARVRVTMRSGEVDPYLILAEGTPSAPRKLAENDDAPSTDDGTAQIEMLLPSTGTYTVFANTATPAVGSYTLDLVSDAGAAPGTVANPEPAADPGAGAPNYAARYPGGGPQDGRYAVLVGISEYPDGVSDLATPVYDARLMRAFLLERMGYRTEDVVLLTDAEATREHILHALGRHLGQAGPEGTVLFYYSGHGSQTARNEAVGPPLDAEPDDRDETLSVWGPGGSVTDLLDDEIRVLLNALPARRKLLIFDSCHSGTAARGAFQTKRLDRDLTEVADAYTDPASYLTEAGLPAYGLTPKPAGRAAEGRPGAVLDLDGLAQPYVLLSGSESDQYSYTYTAWPEEGGRGSRVSVFTYFLLDALEAYAAAPYGALTFEALMEGVRSETVAFMARHRYEQTPHLSGPLQTLPLADFFGR